MREQRLLLLVGRVATAAFAVTLGLSACQSGPTEAPTTTLAASTATATAMPPATRTPEPTATGTPVPLPTATWAPVPALSLVEEWGVDTNEAAWAIDAADLDGDGRQEVIAGSHSRTVTAWNLAGEPQWQYTCLGPVYSLAAGDVDGDGAPEVLVGDDANALYCLDAGGRVQWQMALGGRVTHVAVVERTVLALTWDGALSIFSGSGKLMRMLETPGRPMSLSVLRDGGAAQVIVGTQTGHLAAWTLDRAEPVWNRDLGSPIVSLDARPAADGSARIVAGLENGTVRLLDGAGQGTAAQAVGGGAPVVRFGAEGTSQAVFVGAGEPVSKAFAVDAQANGLWDTPLAGGVWDAASADLESDGRPDWVVATEGGTVTILSADGQIRGGWASPSRVAGLLARDLDGDGKAEVFVREGRFVHLLRARAGGDKTVTAHSVPPTLFRWDGQPAPAPEGVVTLAAVGDIMLARTVGEFGDRYGPNYPFAPTVNLLKDADIAMGNLECAISLGGTIADKFYAFRADPLMADGLQWAGFDLMCLANNHVLDYGVEGFADTERELASRSIQTVGAGANLAAANAARIVTVKGVRIAFLAYAGYVPGGFGADASHAGIAVLDEATMVSAIRAARQEADVVVVILHMGIEYQTSESPEQQHAARAAVDAGASLVIGHHPHVLQPTEVYNGALIAYSLGNFTFDIDSDNVDVIRQGAVLRVWLTRQGVERAELWPTFNAHDAQSRFLRSADGSPEVRLLYQAP